MAGRDSKNKTGVVDVFHVLAVGGLITRQSLAEGATREAALHHGTVAIHELVASWPATHGAGNAGQIAELREPISRGGASIGAAWAENAFATVRLGARLAASLAATTLPKEHVRDLKLPWRCFRVVVPLGVLTDDRDASILVLRHHDGSFFSLTDAMSAVTMGHETSFEHFAAMELTWHERTRELADPTDLDELDPRTRVTKLLHQVVVGVCVELATSAAPKPRARSSSRRRRASHEPQVWDLRLTRDIVVDCREAIREYVRSGRRAPKVQSLVRGHYKRQPCGSGGQDRKWVHIEPYWRGPEDAPIAVRSHVMKT